MITGEIFQFRLLTPSDSFDRSPELAEDCDEMFCEQQDGSDPDGDDVPDCLPGAPPLSHPGGSEAPGVLPPGPGGDDVRPRWLGGGQSGAQSCLGLQDQQSSARGRLNPLDTGGGGRSSYLVTMSQCHNVIMSSHIQTVTCSEEISQVTNTSRILLADLHDETCLKLLSNQELMRGKSDLILVLQTGKRDLTRNTLYCCQTEAGFAIILL